MVDLLAGLWLLIGTALLLVMLAPLLLIVLGALLFPSAVLAGGIVRLLGYDKAPTAEAADVGWQNWR